MKSSRALGLIAASAAASLPLLASVPLGAAAASAPDVTATAGRLASPDGAAQTARIASSTRHRVVGSAKQTRLLFAGAKRQRAAKVTAPWLPRGCKLVEMGPANAGYTAAQMCPLPTGYHLRRGYMLVRGSPKPAVHTTSGASG